MYPQCKLCSRPRGENAGQVAAGEGASASVHRQSVVFLVDSRDRQPGANCEDRGDSTVAVLGQVVHGFFGSAVH